MRRSVIASGILPIAAAVWWWTRPPAPLLDPPLSTSIVAVAPPTSVEARGLPTLAPILRHVMPGVVSITVQTREPAEDNPLYRDPITDNSSAMSRRRSVRSSQLARA
jgi:hypothetical protein